jgi:4-hydroxybenzoate polyprenyltransferase
MLIALVILALAPAAYLGLTALVAASVSVIGGAVYSGGPRLKRFPVVGTLANLLIFTPLAFVGGTPVFERKWLLLLVAFGALLVQNQLIHETAHLQDDQRNEIHTTAVTFGPRFASFAAGSFGILAGVALGLLPLWRENALLWVDVSVVGLFSLIPVIGAFRSQKLNTAKLRIVHRFLSVAVGASAWCLVMLT